MPGSWALDGTDALKIGSDAFADRLARDLFDAAGKAPGKTSLSGAAAILRAIALWDGPEVTVGLRIGWTDDAVVGDLADAEGRVVIIRAEGSTITTESPLPFHRPQGMLPLPVPIDSGQEDLRNLSGIWPVSGRDLDLLLGWILGCYAPSGQRPLLDLAGPQGSGKTLLARMVLSLVDPHANQLMAMPGDTRNLAVVAQRRAVVGFDNLSLLDDELSDALCRLVTPGSGFEVRRLYTDDDVMSFTGTRPVLLNGIPELARQGDLVDRTISITLPPIGSGERLTEAEFLAAWEQVRPAVLGLMFDAVSCALANITTTVLPELPRMADFATWVEAGAPAFGWERGRFLDAYLANRRDASAGVVEGSHIGQFIPQLAEAGFTGTATECLARLAVLAGVEATRHRGWPATPKGLAGILRRLAPALAEAGVVVQFVGPTGHDRQRIIRIHKTGEPGAGAAAVLPFTKPSQAESPRVAQAVDALRAVGVDAGWPASRVAGLALLKAGGNTSIAVQALNALGFPGPGGGPWTTDDLRGVV